MIAVELPRLTFILLLTIGEARILEGAEPQITCNDVIRNFQTKKFLWSKDIVDLSVQQKR